ncbi:MAG: hypothetical protein FWD68_21105 [Alphaproteobacteria bacterium]|nr:hypothetical protein [Alphaproteobacteria bacterium]
MGIPAVVGAGIAAGGWAIGVVSELAQDSSDYLIGVWLKQIRDESNRRVETKEWPKPAHDAFFAQYAP